ncbi:MAG: glycerol-3-phosphate dehydrogenase/oxidase, partial [Acidobacteriota bacterium]
MSRRQVLDAIRRKPEVTVLIVGGGINGIGVFRDLARQGVDVLLVEKGDFCSGTSAASSHMVHGGLRYLENGQFRLVGEAVRERNLLLRNAPHYVQPLPVAIPVFRWLSGLMNAPLQFMGLRKQPAERGALVIKIGLTLYDAYARRQCPGGTLPHHGFILRQSALQRFPRLNPSVKCVASYYDAAVSVPERIGLELVLDAESDSPSARAVNYLRLRRAEGGSVTLQDADTGEELVVKPRVVVNASGPWVDIVNRAMGQDTRFIGGTKGSHIVLQNPGLRAAMGEHEWFFENADGRMVLLFPLGDNVLVGTSDIRVEGPEDVRCTEEEVDYFLGMIGKVFPGI